MHRGSQERCCETEGRVSQVDQKSRTIWSGLTWAPTCVPITTELQRGHRWMIFSNRRHYEGQKWAEMGQSISLTYGWGILRSVVEEHRKESSSLWLFYLSSFHFYPHLPHSEEKLRDWHWFLIETPLICQATNWGERNSLQALLWAWLGWFDLMSYGQWGNLENILPEFYVSFIYGLFWWFLVGIYMMRLAPKQNLLEACLEGVLGFDGDKNYCKLSDLKWHRLMIL